ncbi:MAG: hypothetical protein KAF41_04465, partial [Flavobacterium sp.]|nr:hypothetical protein [Flavobacterium sp.]
SLIVNTANDKLKTFYNPRASNLLVTDGGVAGIIDQPLYGLYSYRWGGLDPQNGDPLGFVDGKISKRYDSMTNAAYPVDQLVYHGRDVPSTFGAFTNTFRYGKFTLAATLSYRFNYFFRKSSINYISLNTQNVAHSDYVLRWQRPGDELNTFVPSRIYPGNSNRETFYSRSSVLVSRADNIRLQFINLTYSPEIKNPNLFQSLEFFGIASNLGLIWKKTDFDVDPDFQDIRPTRNYTVGIRLQLK